MQYKLRDHLRSRGYRVDEATRISGGQIDLLFSDLLTIENKIYTNPTDNPLDVAEAAGWQARRYTIPTSTEILSTVVGYKPASEFGHKKGRDLINFRILDDDKTIEIRLAVPVDYSNPSSAKKPETS